MGLFLVVLLLSPFAAVYALTGRDARAPSAVGLFFAGAVLWPWTVAGIFELLEMFGLFLPFHVGWLVLAAPLLGVLLNGLRRERETREFRVGAGVGALLIGGDLWHVVYWENFEHNPTFSDGELVGTWRGGAGTLRVDAASVRRSGDFTVVVGLQGYRVCRSFGQLCLTTQGDPDAIRVLYRKW